MAMLCKVTDDRMQTRGGFQWTLGVWREATGYNENLCSDGWIHCYDHPLIAMLMMPTHVGWLSPRLFACEGRGERADDAGLKCGYKGVRLLHELDKPNITDVQRIAFSLLCARSVCHEPEFNLWVNEWLENSFVAIAAVTYDKDRDEEWDEDLREVVAESVQAMLSNRGLGVDVIALAETAVREY